VISYNNLFVGTAVGFAASAILVLIARLPAHSPEPSTTTFWERLPTGLRVFARTPSLRFLMAANVVVAAGTAIVLVNSVVYAKGVFGLDDAALALALGAYGVGSLIVALNVPWIVDRIGVLRTMSIGAWTLVVGMVAAAVMTAVAVSTGEGWWALLATWALLGASTSLINTPSSRLLADASTPANRNLVYTAQFALSHGCFLISYPIAGWLGAIGLPVAAVALLVLAIIGAIAVVMLRRPAVTAVMEESPAPTQG
ncbi:MAG TPA: MFS transporter, partial [Microbacterium sp.]|nr:MFS transporter [Microbacterium sp.]